MKRVLASVLASQACRVVAALLAPPGVQVVFLHRFATGEGGEPGAHSLHGLRVQLEWLRREKVPVVSARDLVTAFQEGSPLPRRGIVFTVDDGYADFGDAADIFLHYDVPVSLFVTTDFPDGRHWMWWDRLVWICENGNAGTFQWSEGPRRLQVVLKAPGERMSEARRIAAAVQFWPTAARRRAMEWLEREVGAEVPECPPQRFAALSWDSIRRLEARGVEVGPHTVTHPILAACTDEEVHREIHESWARCNAELHRPLPLFAFPNGSALAFGEREKEEVAGAGLHAAFSCLRGRVVDQADRWELPRFGLPHSEQDLALLTSGTLELLGRV